MYEAHFGLRERPFSTSPDPRFLFLTAQHQEALAKCQAVIESRMGASAIYGDIGAGKTTLARRLLDLYSLPSEERQKGPGYNLAYLVHPTYPTPFQFVRQVLFEFGLTQPRRSLSDHLTELQAFLQTEHEAGKINVLIVDEAHRFTPPLLEIIRQLLNFEASDAKYLQVALFGETELATRLDKNPALKDRIASFGALTSLRRDDVEALIAFRWKVAGGETHPFTPQAVDRIYAYSQGLPRRICKLCDAALIRAYAHDLPSVDAGLVEVAAEELRLTQPPPSARPAREPRTHHERQQPTG